jgi:Ser/Thr protein kinase RdoA (MazF antagonist)
VPEALENTVFVLETSTGKYLVKVFDTLAGKVNIIRKQLDLMEFLYNEGVPVQKIMKTKSNDSLFKYKKKEMVILEYVEGRHPKRFSRNLIKEYAKKIAEMHKALMNLPNKEDYDFGWIDYYIDTKNLRNVKGFDSRKKYANLIKEYEKNVDRSKLRKCVIHADIDKNNTLVKNGKLVAFIDWSDARLGYLVEDLAFFITQNIPNDKEKTSLFLKTYEEFIPLNSEEKKSIYYFIKFRIFDIINWCREYSIIHKDQKKELDECARFNIKEYEILDKTGLEKFVKQIE